MVNVEVIRWKGVGTGKKGRGEKIDSWGRVKKWGRGDIGDAKWDYGEERW